MVWAQQSIHWPLYLRFSTLNWPQNKEWLHWFCTANPQKKGPTRECSFPGNICKKSKISQRRRHITWIPLHEPSETRHHIINLGDRSENFKRHFSLLNTSLQQSSIVTWPQGNILFKCCFHYTLSEPKTSVRGEQAHIFAHFILATTISYYN